MKNLLFIYSTTAIWLSLANAVPNPAASAFSTSTQICGRQGYDSGTESYRDIANGTYAACSDACVQSSRCKSFAYSPDVCYLYDVAVANNFDENSISPYTFYDKSCIQTLTTSSAAPTSTSKRTQTTTATKSRTKQTTTGQSSTTLSKSSQRRSSTSTTGRKTTTSSIPTTTKASTTIVTVTTKTTSAYVSHETCSIDGSTCSTHNFTTITDPCNHGCGCRYYEGCGFSLSGGTSIRTLVQYTYSDCIRACDLHQPSCVGVNYQPSGGVCYLLSSVDNVGDGSSGWAALRDYCDNPCSAATSCGQSSNSNEGIVCF